jgi:hypothetical protein
MRKAGEAEARVKLAAARRALDDAKVEQERARAARVAAGEAHRASIEEARALLGKGGASGTLARSEAFVARKRALVDEGKMREKSADDALDGAARSFEAARAELEDAVRRREAAEAESDRHRERDARGRMRREEAAVDDTHRRRR